MVPNNIVSRLSDVVCESSCCNIIYIFTVHAFELLSQCFQHLWMYSFCMYLIKEHALKEKKGNATCERTVILSN